jgi:hypothetical protein
MLNMEISRKLVGPPGSARDAAYRPVMPSVETSGNYRSHEAGDPAKHQLARWSHEPSERRSHDLAIAPGGGPMRLATGVAALVAPVL